MAYNTSNAALALDMSSAPAYRQPERKAPKVVEKPAMQVLTGGGKGFDRAISPVTARVFKAALVVVAFACVVFGACVFISNAALDCSQETAAIQTAMKSSEKKAKELEVLNAAYGNDARIKQLAESYGMKSSDGSVTLDLSDVPAGSESASSAR